MKLYVNNNDISISLHDNMEYQYIFDTKEPKTWRHCTDEKELYMTIDNKRVLIFLLKSAFLNYVKWVGNGVCDTRMHKSNFETKEIILKIQYAGVINENLLFCNKPIYFG